MVDHFWLWLPNISKMVELRLSVVAAWLNSSRMNIHSGHQLPLWLLPKNIFSIKFFWSHMYIDKNIDWVFRVFSRICRYLPSPLSNIQTATAKRFFYLFLISHHYIFIHIGERLRVQSNSDNVLQNMNETKTKKYDLFIRSLNSMNPINILIQFSLPIKHFLDGFTSVIGVFFN